MKKKYKRTLQGFMALVLCLVCVLGTALADGEIAVQFPIDSDDGKFFGTNWLSRSYANGEGDTPDNAFLSLRGVSISETFNFPLWSGGWTDRPAIFLNILPSLVKVDTGKQGYSAEMSYRECISYLYGKSFDEIDNVAVKNATSAKLTVEWQLYKITPISNESKEVKRGSCTLLELTDIPQKSTYDSAVNGLLLYNLEADTSYQLVFYLYLSCQVENGGSTSFTIFPMEGDKGTSHYSAKPITQTQKSLYCFTSVMSTALKTDTKKAENRIVKLYEYTLGRTEDGKELSPITGSTAEAVGCSPKSYLDLIPKTTEHSTPAIKVQAPDMKKMDFSGENPMEIINGKGMIQYRPNANEDAKTLSSWFRLIRLFAITLCVFGIMGAIIRIAQPNVSGFAVFRLREALSGWVLLLILIGAATTVLSMLVQILFF